MCSRILFVFSYPVYADIHTYYADTVLGEGDLVTNHMTVQGLGLRAFRTRKWNPQFWTGKYKAWYSMVYCIVDPPILDSNTPMV